MSNENTKKHYFYGEEVSPYGVKSGFIDYRTLAKAIGDVIMNNGIISELSSKDYYFELVNGSDYNDETEDYYEIYQEYIISHSGYELLKMWTDEIVYYCEELNMYVWGVTHWGTPWNCVLTGISIEEFENDIFRREGSKE